MHPPAPRTVKQDTPELVEHWMVVWPISRHRILRGLALDSHGGWQAPHTDGFCALGAMLWTGARGKQSGVLCGQQQGAGTGVVGHVQASYTLHNHAARESAFMHDKHFKISQQSERMLLCPPHTLPPCL